MKKLSAIGLLAVVIAMVIVFGLCATTMAMGQSPKNESSTGGSLANVSPANVSHVNVSPANVSHVNVSPANISPANVSPANISPANVSPANISPANVSPANVSPAGEPAGRKIMPWAIVVAIVVLSFLIFFVIKGGRKKRGPKAEDPSGGSIDYFRPQIQFKVCDKKTNKPMSGAKIEVTGTNLSEYGHADPDGLWDYKLKRGEYNCRIVPVKGYKPESGSFSVEDDGSVSVPESGPFSVEDERTIFIPISKRTGNLTVQVKDSRTKNTIRGANVSVGVEEKRTDEEGKARFSDLTIGEKRIFIEEISGVYSSGIETCEIKEDTTTEVSISLTSHLRISSDKMGKLEVLRNQLQDNYRRVSTYDPCIPYYYKSSVDIMVNLVKEIAGKPMLFVDAKNPEETIGLLVDAIDLASQEIIEVMTSKRNVDVYSAAMSLEKAEIRAKHIDSGDHRVLDYIRDADGFYSSYNHTVQSKLFDIDTLITRKTGELNVLPVSGLWRVARMLLHEASSSPADSIKNSAMLLIADFILGYADDMLRDAKIIERLKIMVL
jgi:hypothetical protein